MEELQEALLAFLRLPWFRRVWTAQEILLSKSATFYCGKETFDLAVFLRYVGHTAMHWLCCPEVIKDDISRLTSTALLTLLDEITILSMTLGRRYDFAEISQMVEYTHDEDFLRLQAHFRLRQASDPRDRIYGLLGLARSDFQARLRPDYNLSVERVFTTAASAMIEESGDLEILSHTYGTSRLQLPSWVPDWTSDLDDLLLHQGRYQNLENYYIGGNWRQHPRTVASGALLVESVVFDEITATSLPARDMLNRELLLAAQDLICLKGHEDEIYQDHLRNSTIEKVFWWTLLDGPGLLMDDTTPLEDYNDVKDQGGLSLPSEKVRWPKQIHAWISHLLAENFSHAGETSSQIQGDFWSQSAGRRFGTTRDGYFGFVPDSARPGDHLAVILGGPMVYALRSADVETARDLPPQRAYQLLGDAKLSSEPHVRDGVISGRRSDELSIEEICLV